MMYLDEVWAPVSGFPSYEVSTYGRLYSHNQNLILKPWTSHWGYLQAKLSMNGITKTVTIHRLVAETFLSGASPDLEVNHIDGDKTYNHVDNLEWVTREENIQHGYDTELISSRKRRVENLDTGEIYPSITEAAHSLGCSPGALSTTISLRGSYKGTRLIFKD
jgi:hypothetical protein